MYQTTITTISANQCPFICRCVVTNLRESGSGTALSIGKWPGRTFSSAGIISGYKQGKRPVDTWFLIQITFFCGRFGGVIKKRERVWYKKDSIWSTRHEVISRNPQTSAMKHLVSLDAVYFNIIFKCFLYTFDSLSFSNIANNFYSLALTPYVSNRELMNISPYKAFFEAFWKYIRRSM